MTKVDLLTSIIAPPYLEKENAVKNICRKRVRDYLSDASGVVWCTYILGLLSAILLPLVQPLVSLFNFFFWRVSSPGKNNWCRNTDPTSGIIQRHTCSKTGRHYVTRFYDPLQDVIDVPNAFASGFMTDSFSRFMMPEYWMRHRYSAEWFLSQIEAPGTDVMIQEWEEQEKVVGIALICQRPTSWWSDYVESVRMMNILIRLFFVSPTTAHRMLRTTFALIDRHHSVASCFDKQVFLLKYIGVEKGFQGQGIGSNMMRHLVEHCDTLQIPAYLECSAAVNIPLYERFGFRVFEEYHCTPECPPLQLMIRLPEAVTPKTSASSTLSPDTASAPSTLSPDTASTPSTISQRRSPLSNVDSQT